MTSQQPDEQDQLNQKLDQLLDQESDAEFGLPVFQDHLDQDLTPLVLRNWSAQDFANIYVRFHPHVLRQAKRYLTNHSQAEEITQDAFLYLMTSLPEVDSEIGVLKLLKWKVRYLALDLIKANSQASFAPIDNQPELSIDDSALSLELERADDAAIVALALAKLEPRQREALVASLYEEKSSAQVAAQLGLNENATRQLVFRAKAAFKKALVGEAETRGLTVSEIISVAARKASKEAGKYISVASGFILVLAISIGVLPNLGSSTTQLIADAPAPNGIAQTDSAQTGTGQAVPESQAATDSSTSSSAIGADSGSNSDASSSSPNTSTSQSSAGQLASNQLGSNQPTETDLVIGSEPSNPSSNPSISPAQSARNIQLASLGASVDQSPFDPWLLDPLFEQSRIASSLFSETIAANSNSATLVSLVSDQGFWADLRFQPSSKNPFSAVKIGLYVDGQQYFARLSQSDLLVFSTKASSETYVFIGSVGSLTDVKGNSFSNTRLDGAQVRIEVTLDTATGFVYDTSLALATGN